MSDDADAEPLGVCDHCRAEREERGPCKRCGGISNDDFVWPEPSAESLAEIPELTPEQLREMRPRYMHPMRRDWYRNECAHPNRYVEREEPMSPNLLRARYVCPDCGAHEWIAQ